MEVGSRAHPGKASLSIRVFVPMPGVSFNAMGIDVVGSSLPTSRRLFGPGKRSADGASISFPAENLFGSALQSCTSPNRPFSGRIWKER